MSKLYLKVKDIDRGLIEEVIKRAPKGGRSVTICSDLVQMVRVLWESAYGHRFVSDWSGKLEFGVIGDSVLAETNAEPHYCRFEMKFDPLQIIDNPQVSLGDVVMHELTHVFTWRYTSLVESLVPESMKERIQEEAEDMVENLAQCILKVQREAL